ncbi:SDR family NAD(P)-dependent oxidoreductase [Archangium violaceum]|uniref:type I polyketide synthase n=1 Tax=Archangium violaceum TaxID=83451 RepID=UPI00194EDE9C|nr:type I polyketide synthase [Archangium violaceum]QRN93953.1 SDR family NAD(P)-dependent oxidoreductase [Archangium violaceum]
MTESEIQPGLGAGSAKTEQELGGAEAGTTHAKGAEPIAVVGLACRFPGAPDAEAFWRLLCDRRDLLREVPPDRWDSGVWYDADPQAPGKMVTRHGYFLDGVSQFDPLFFGISPREAAEMDPQQRLMLEVCWEALEDAGVPSSSLKGSRTGVFMGAIWHEYADRHLTDRASVTLHSSTGQSLNIVANRLSYVLGLRGPSLSVDTACSSSLVAVHLACQSLRSGECRMALVGGANLMFSPEANVLLSKFGGLSPDGRSKAFAVGADGFGRGEGAGLVVLQPLSAALASGARIYCIIRGSAVNNNGTGNGLTAPSVPGQAALLHEAYERAGVPPSRVHYVETHGTGTALGDPTEASALGSALGEGRAIDRPLLIGSVKANIGHLEGAAGIAGLIKVALSLSRRLVPPHMMHGEPNPRIPFGELRLSLPQRLMPWPGEDEPATAGVSAFGWGGTNAHVVLEESPVGREELLPLAADSAEALLAQAAKAEALVLHEQEPVCLRDLCRTWALRAGRGPHRAALTFRTRAELTAQLKSLRQGKRRAGLFTSEAEAPPRLAFLCAPQGSQWPSMGRELLATEPVFRACVETLDKTFMPLAGWSLVEALREPSARILSDEDAAEPLTLAMQLGLAALWRSWGVEPEVVVGHGVGEVAAACIAGGLEAADAVWMVYRASRLRQWDSLRDELEKAQERLRARGLEGRWVSCLSGDARIRTLRQPVRFTQAMERLVGEGLDTFVELSPHPSLCRPVEQLLRKAGRTGLVVGSLRRDEPRAALLEALGALHARGVQVRWTALPPPEVPVAELPSGEWLAEPPGRTELLPLSAQTPEALVESANLLLKRLEDRPLSVHDVCYSASVHRAHLHYRLALMVRTTADVRDGLSAFIRGEMRPGVAMTRRADGRHQPVVFVFPGQGSQWLGMGRRLLNEEPVFRSAIEQCDGALRRFVDWSLLELLSSEDGAWMERIDQVQPALFSVQVALARLWRAWGVVPDVVVGHSMGEVAAAHVAGALDLVDAARIICRRSLLLRRLSGQGGMAVTELTLDEARAAIIGLEDRLSVAASNSPRSTVLSGELQALTHVLETLEASHVFCRRVKVDVASHSPQMEPLREELLHALEGLAPRRGDVPLFSTVTGEMMDGSGLDPSYWVRNLRDPVLLSPVVERLVTSGHSLFVEVSPHPVLLPSIEQTLSHLSMEGSVLPSVRREQPEREVMLETLGILYAAGREVEWTALHREGGRFVRLPDYPWQRQHCWFQAGTLKRSNAESSTSRGQSLPGLPRRSSLRPGAIFWDVELGLEHLPYLKDHRVQGSAILPAAAYLDWAVSAAHESIGPGPWVVEGMQLDEALVLPDEQSRMAELLLEPGEEGKSASFKVSSFVPTPGVNGPEAWTTHVTGTVRALDASEAAVPPASVSLEEVQGRCREMLLGDVFYFEMDKRGLQYGPAFRGLQEVWRRDGEALGRIDSPPSLGKVTGLHTALLDAALQVMLAAVPMAESTIVPVWVRRFVVSRRGVLPRWAHARLESRAPERQGTTLEGDILLLDEQGAPIARVEGLSLMVLPARTDKARGEQDRSLFELTWRKVALSPRPRNGEEGAPWLVFMDRGGRGRELVALLEARGESCVRVEPGVGARKLGPGHYTVAPGSRADLDTVLAESFPEARDCAGVVYLWGLDLPATEVSGERALEETVRACGGALRVVQALLRFGWREPPHLWLVTSGAWSVAGSPVSGALQAALWGLGRSIGHEHPELRCTCVDLEPSSGSGGVESLERELAAEPGDEQVALRADGRYAARLIRRPPHVEGLVPEMATLPATGRHFRVEIPPSGIIGGLVVRAAERRPPGPGEVELQVDAAGLSFADVMRTMGFTPQERPDPAMLGLDCAGRVVALGEGVTGLSVGQAVMTFAPGSLASHVVTDARLVVPLPRGLGPVESSTLPGVFLMAWYALHYLGRLRRGERVLIHSAAGGLGLAAVQVAQALGAEILATAGTPEKRELLRSMGITHVMDSRSLAFVHQVRAITGGEGVDVVLNSLSGEAVSRGLEVLAPDGRFLDVSRHDAPEGHSLELQAIRQPRHPFSYMSVDLVGLRMRRPALCGQLLREVVEQVEAGVLKPLPHQSFPVSRVTDAFRTMAQGVHMGRLIVTMEDPELRLVPPRHHFQVLPDATYLITGGLGGLGLSAARWLVEHGARNLLLVGRGGASGFAREVIQSMEAQGVRVEIARADVADMVRMSDVLARTRAELPPLRGVLHCAGVLDDGIVEHQDPERFRSVMTPKIQGAWNLHALTREEPLDFFVLYSSVASLLGTPGQSNYAAANAAMDALAHHRRQQGLPALSINWGPFSEVGLAVAQSNRGERLAYRGMASFSPKQGEALLERLLKEGAVQPAAVALDVRQWLEFFPSAASLRVWEELAAQAEGASSRGRSELLLQLRRSEPGARTGLLENYLRERLAQVLRIDPARVGRHDPFRSLGLDSLMSLELRNRIESVLELKLSATLLWAHSTLAALATFLLGQLGLTVPSREVTPSKPRPAVEPRAAGVEPKAAAPVNGKHEVEKPRSPEPKGTEPGMDQIAALSEEALMGLMDDVLSSWEDAK